MEGRLLELTTRRELYELIKNNPGLHMREISRQSGLLPSLVEYHLRHLLKDNLLYSIKEQGYTRFYIAKDDKGEPKADIFSSRQKKILHLLRQKTALEIVVFIMEKGKAKHKEIFDFLEISGSTLSYYLKKLTDADVLIHYRTGKDKGFQLKDKDEIIRILIVSRIKPPSLVEGFITTWDDFFNKKY